MRASSSTTTTRSGRWLGLVAIGDSELVTSGILLGFPGRFGRTDHKLQILRHRLAKCNHPVKTACAYKPSSFTSRGWNPMRSRPFAALLIAVVTTATGAAWAETPPPQGVLSLNASASVEVTKDLLNVVLTATRDRKS